VEFVTPANQHVQYAALPYRKRGNSIEIMLITSRDTGRWLIPKGWPKIGMSPHDCAALEAFEEGGLVGRIAERAIGCFRYEKSLADGSVVQCAVEVFLLEVKQQRRSWPEQSERRTCWFALEEAAGSVQEEELQKLIRNLAEYVNIDL
jgi:8-oxo-dGTP pyrophosphatase MutT (NUDIX family)